MSYDVWVTEKNWHSDSFNHTSNCGGMWHKALGIELRRLQGMKTQDAIPILINGITEMIANPAVYKEMNPENGWGDYESAREYLQKLLTLCQKYPDGIMGMSS